jgi:prepilin-type N-terminal cleavage/methylation domain-containing protein
MRHDGFTLVEGLIALAVGAMVLVPALALCSAALRESARIQRRGLACAVADALAGSAAANVRAGVEEPEYRAAKVDAAPPPRGRVDAAPPPRGRVDAAPPPRASGVDAAPPPRASGVDAAPPPRVSKTNTIQIHATLRTIPPETPDAPWRVEATASPGPDDAPLALAIATFPPVKLDEVPAASPAAQPPGATP